ncbi:hypothetical protein LTR64_004555 [Lithohypha guttulata]|uniref:uncharacterized protein n=1 Tax=Lithohypha guttulata TaxID=1690604 RepID=UPI002DDDD656|nr:hypothetical protein LTR51_006147 [Lithohypha guttulata]
MGSYNNMNRPSPAITPLLISDATRDLVLSTRLPEQIKQKFAERSLLDHAYIPTSVLPQENEIDVEVYDDIFELLQGHNDMTSQKAMFFLLADIGYELGYTIRQLAREGPADDENGVADLVLLRPVEAEPGATLRATLDAVNPRQFPTPQTYEGHNANVDCKFTCPIPPRVSSVVTFGFWHSMTRHLRTAHHFSAADTSELTNNVTMSHLKQLFGPYLITDLETALRPKRRIKKSSVVIGEKPGERLSGIDEQKADTSQRHTDTASAEPEAGQLGVTRFPFMEAMLDAMDREDEENGTYVRGS